MTEKLQKVKEKIIEAVPDIMKLQFGCRVKLKQNGTDGIILQKAYGEWLYHNYDSRDVYVREFDRDEILGRPIRLADVIFALKKFVDLNELYQKNGWTIDELVMPGNYDLLNDNLEDQSKNLISFLYSLFYPHYED